MMPLPSAQKKPGLPAASPPLTCDPVAQIEALLNNPDLSAVSMVLSRLRDGNYRISMWSHRRGNWRRSVGPTMAHAINDLYQKAM